MIELWEKIGALDEVDLANVIARLFTTYEMKLQNNPNHREALQFFNTLEQVVEQVEECNLNRR